MQLNILQLRTRARNGNKTSRPVTEALLRRGVTAVVLGGLALLGSAKATQANTIFASFTHAEYIFSNTGTPSTTGLNTDTLPFQITFEFHQAVSGDSISYAANQPIQANVAMSTQVANTVTGTNFLDQPLKNGQMKFTDQFGNNLLTISNFTANLTGVNTGSTADQSIDTTLAVQPDIATYSSDFLQFSPSSDVVSSIAVTLDRSTTFQAGANNYVNTFAADADGSFSGNLASVPEPSGTCLIGVAAMGLLAHRSRLRRA
jgi:hypothetical protein